MTEDEYQHWKADGDNRVGRCPYCGKPGWIVGDLEWCEHVAGTYDYFGNSEPICPIVEGEEFDELRTILKFLAERSEEDANTILARLSGPRRAFLRKARNRDPALFWVILVRGRRLTADVDESLSSTTYETIFVKNPALTRESLKTRAADLARAFRRAVPEAFPPNPGPQ
jgi:hypothetical protein